MAPFFAAPLGSIVAVDFESSQGMMRTWAGFSWDSIFRICLKSHILWIRTYLGMHVFIYMPSVLLTFYHFGCFLSRLRRDHTGNVPRRRAHASQVNVWDCGKHISIAREARHVLPSHFISESTSLINLEKYIIIADNEKNGQL